MELQKITAVNLDATFLRLADLSNYVMKHEISKGVTIHAQRTGQITCQTCCVYMDIFLTVLGLGNGAV
jgi:hypothetical protein